MAQKDIFVLDVIKEDIYGKIAKLLLIIIVYVNIVKHTIHLIIVLNVTKNNSSNIWIFY